MALILSIDTSTTVCSVALHDDGCLMGHQGYYLQKSHSSLLPIIGRQLVENCGKQLKDLEAVAVAEGPGSYTGLRIGTATAKGLAYALQIPLIAVNTLDTMIAQVLPQLGSDQELLCPMIDARRMEVFCKLVDATGEEVWDTRPLIVEEDSFSGLGKPLVLFGDGSDKLHELFQDSESIRFISGIVPSAVFMGAFAENSYQAAQFEDVVYFEPAYLKEFRTNQPSVKFSV